MKKFKTGQRIIFARNKHGLIAGKYKQTTGNHVYIIRLDKPFKHGITRIQGIVALAEDLKLEPPAKPIQTFRCTGCGENCRLAHSALITVKGQKQRICGLCAETRKPEGKREILQWGKVVFNIVPHGWQCDIIQKCKGRPAEKGTTCRDWGDDYQSAQKLFTKLSTIGESGK